MCWSRWCSMRRPRVVREQHETNAYTPSSLPPCSISWFIGLDWLATSTLNACYSRSVSIQGKCTTTDQLYLPSSTNYPVRFEKLLACCASNAFWQQPLGSGLTSQSGIHSYFWATWKSLALVGTGVHQNLDYKLLGVDFASNRNTSACSRINRKKKCKMNFSHYVLKALNLLVHRCCRPWLHEFVDISLMASTISYRKIKAHFKHDTNIHYIDF